MGQEIGRGPGVMWFQSMEGSLVLKTQNQTVKRNVHNGMTNIKGKCDQQQDQIFTPKEHKVSGKT